MNLSELQLEVDPHIHTTISGHSWSTLSDYILHAKHIGMKGFCITEHGPATPSGPPEFTPHAQMMIPDVCEGIRVFKGTEANIISFDGKLDIRDKYLDYLDFCIASIHSFSLKAGTVDQNTDVYCAVLDNPHIDVIGHPDDPRVPCSLETLVLEVKKRSKLIEINNSSLTSHRKNCRSNVILLARLCMKHDVRVCVSSDAHWYTALGSFGSALELMDELCFPPELIVNLSLEGFQSYIDERKARLTLK
jgi:putative hydrolase